MSSPPSNSISNRDESFYNKCLHQKEVANGIGIRLLETSRRQHSADEQQRPALVSRSKVVQQRSRRISDAGRHHNTSSSSVIVHESKLLGMSTTSNQKDEQVNKKTREVKDDAFQSETEKAFDRLFGPPGLPSPPPTPRSKRLPTPDLEPPKTELFCDCCARYTKQMSCQLDDAADSSKEDSVRAMEPGREV
jgi:hypothetical protein